MGDINPVTKLTPTQQERLAHFIQEASEVTEQLQIAIQTATKILIHGYDSSNPTAVDPLTNRQSLANEIRDLLFSSHRLCKHHDIDLQLDDPENTQCALWERKKKWFHFQED